MDEQKALNDSNLLLDPFQQRWGEYSAKLKLCQAEFSEVAVHDLRVAMRRLLALIEIIQGFDRHARLQNLRRSLKAELNGFDDLRDIQVMLLNISENGLGLDGIEPFKNYLEKREKKLLQTAKKQVAAIKSSAFQRRMLNVQKTLAVLPVEELPALLLGAADKAYGLVQERYSLINSALPASIHKVRIAFKKFRYTVECVHPVLVDFPESQFEQMHAYQTLMGNIQDAEVFSQVLTKFKIRHPEHELETARNLSEQRISKSLSIYLEHKAEVLTFWRANPTAEFPWNIKPITLEPV